MAQSLNSYFSLSPGRSFAGGKAYINLNRVHGITIASDPVLEDLWFWPRNLWRPGLPHLGSFSSKIGTEDVRMK